MSFFLYIYIYIYLYIKSREIKDLESKIESMDNTQDSESETDLHKELLTLKTRLESAEKILEKAN